AQGTGAFLSNPVAGYVVHRAGANAAFYMLGGIATVGLIFFWLLMPETKGIAHGNQAARATA
nr:MFS transporter [Chthoniobacterales bacterium]